MPPPDDNQQLNDLHFIAEHLVSRHQLRVIARKKDVWGTDVILANDIACVRIRASVREPGRVFVDIGRLEDGHFPGYPKDFLPTTVLTYFDIGDIATLRHSNLSPTLAEKLERDPLKAADQIEIIDSCCEDILAGDFSIFEPAAEIVRARARAFGKA